MNGPGTDQQFFEMSRETDPTRKPSGQPGICTLYRAVKEPRNEEPLSRLYDSVGDGFPA